MRPAAVAWERAAEVREAADGWRRATVIDAPTHDAIRRAYADPRIVPAAVWRALTAVVVSATVLCVAGAVFVAFEPGTATSAMLLLALAGVALVTTERLDASPRLTCRGAAGAIALWGTVFFLGGVGLLLGETARIRFDTVLTLVLFAAALAWAAGCWRWGVPAFAGLSAVSLLAALARLPQARLLWVVGGTALAGLAARRLDAAAWAPSHRRAASVTLVVGLAAVYAAVNVYSLDLRWLEALRPLAPARTPPPALLRVLAGLATAVLPLAILAWAWRSRRTLVLDVGIVLLAVSLVTLRQYVHLAPLWLVLIGAGAAVVALALAVERALRRAPGGEIAGVTADALFADERRAQLLQALPVAATLAPAAPPAAVEEKGFAPGGGRFGGGGASGKF